MKFSSLATLEVVILTTSGVASNKKVWKQQHFRFSELIAFDKQIINKNKKFSLAPRRAYRQTVI